MYDEVVYSDTRARNMFGYRVEGDEMRPFFRKGDIAIVNPNLEPRHGDYVVARKGSACMLRLYVEGEGGPLLASTAPGETPIPARTAMVLGRVVERRRSYR